MRRPAFQFYPADWRKDVGLRSCSIAARGLWVDLLCLAHECEPYGHLTVNGRAMNAAQMAGQVGITAVQCAKLMDELTDNGVARKTAEGVFYSKRMVEDERIRNLRADGGKAGSEHGIKGAEHGTKGGRPANTRGDKKPPLVGDSEPPLKPPPSSSSSSSSSEALASDGKPSVPELTKEELWGAGRSLLHSQGLAKDQCGSFIGKLAKDYGPEVALDAVRSAVVEQPAEARGYLKATCQRLSGERIAPPIAVVTVPSKAADETQRYLAQLAADKAEVEAQRIARRQAA